MRLFTLLVFAGAAIAGCSAAPKPLQIAPAALVGCRAPEEPGCERCCTAGPRSCTVYESFVTGREREGERVYNNFSSLDTCPHGCRPCAKCSKRNEEILNSLLSQEKDCDCSTVEIGADPCFDRASCRCYCMWLRNLTRSCLMP